jgi:hypothetical protein
MMKIEHLRKDSSSGGKYWTIGYSWNGIRIHHGSESRSGSPSEVFIAAASCTDGIDAEIRKRIAAKLREGYTHVPGHRGDVTTDGVWCLFENQRLTPTFLKALERVANDPSLPHFGKTVAGINDAASTRKRSDPLPIAEYRGVDISFIVTRHHFGLSATQRTNGHWVLRQLASSVAGSATLMHASEAIVPLARAERSTQLLRDIYQMVDPRELTLTPTVFRNHGLVSAAAF